MDKELKIIKEKEKRENVISQIGEEAYKFYDISKVDKSIIEKCKGYPNTSLYFTGSVRCGKTFTAISIAKLFSGFLYKKPNDIFREYRTCESAAAENMYINSIVKCKNLIIDDFGTEKMTEFSKSIIYEILDKRCERNKNGMIITSNLTISDISKIYDARIAGRIYETCRVVKFEDRPITGRKDENIQV